MRGIKLNDSEIEHLFEMIEKLFPEYGDATFYKCSHQNADMLCFFLKENDSDLFDHCNLFIHWYEFCMTHLVEKILNPKPELPSRIIKDEFSEFFWSANLYANNLGGKHPVEYLYEQFKKLKL